MFIQWKRSFSMTDLATFKDFRNKIYNAEFADTGLAKGCVLIFHGSNGLQSDTSSLTSFFLEQGLDVYMVDHFQLRGSTKNNYSSLDKIRLSYFDMANDCHKILNDFLLKTYKHVHLAGFSLGANAAILVNNHKVENCFAYYPSYLPASESLLKSYTKNTTFFFGKEDNWTPARAVKYFKSQEILDGSIVEFDNTTHGFFKLNYKKEVDVYPLDEYEELYGRVYSDREYLKRFNWSIPFLDRNLFPQRRKVNIESNELSRLESLKLITLKLS